MALTVLEVSSTISTFFRTRFATPVMINNIAQDHAFTFELLYIFVADLHPVVQNIVQNNRHRGLKFTSKGRLPNFIERKFLIVA